jgi:hypothetical protein
MEFVGHTSNPSSIVKRYFSSKFIKNFKFFHNQCFYYYPLNITY